MIVVFGLVILIAAVIVGMAGVLTNGGSAHALTHGFAVFGYHVTGSAGTLFLYGIVVGALALFGLTVLLAGARRTSRRGSVARRRLQQSRRETADARQARDDLIDQRDTARPDPASTPANGTARSVPQLSPADGPVSRMRLLGRRWDPRRSAAARSEPLIGQPAADASAADASASDVPADAAGSDAPADVPADAPAADAPAASVPASVPAGAAASAQ